MRQIMSGIQRIIGATGFGFNDQINMENLTKYEFASLHEATAISLTTMFTTK